MKILPRAFILSTFYSLFISAASYFLLKFLCKSFAQFLLPFVFLFTVLLFSVLSYLSAVHFKRFFACIKDEKLIIKSGFIIKREKILKLNYTVSVKNVSTPVMRLLKISNILLIFEGSVCILPLLRKADAHELFGEIIKIRDTNEEI